jgi:GWxTD domain-containing protein
MRFQTVRSVCVAAALGLAATSGFALDAKYVEWGRGPAQYFMTRDEIAQWKTIRTDADAEAFVALFWARRDPTPETARNEFHERFDSLVRTADEKLGGPRNHKGSLTDRGRMLLLFGPPEKMERQQRGIAPQPTTPQQDTVSGPTIVWTYDGDHAKALFHAVHNEIVFVDRNNGDFTLNRGGLDIAAAEQRVIQNAITQPDLKAPRTFAATPAAPAAALTALPTPSLREAVAAFRTSGKSPHDVFATWGEFVTAGGATFIPISLYVPKASGIPTTGALTFFGTIEDASGNGVAAFETPATLAATKDDFIVEHTLAPLPAGTYRGVFGLADATGTPVALVSAPMTLTGALDKNAPAASPLILSNNLYPLAAAQNETEPYAFGGVKVVPKGDRAFSTTDDLWYFLEVRNPGLNEAGVPKLQVKLEIEGVEAEGGKTVRMAAPPREMDTPEMKGVPHHHGVGSAIPLSGFKPGDYTFSIKVTDTVRKSSYTMKEPFRIVR